METVVEIACPKVNVIDIIDQAVLILGQQEPYRRLHRTVSIQYLLDSALKMLDGNIMVAFAMIPQ